MMSRAFRVSVMPPSATVESNCQLGSWKVTEDALANARFGPLLNDLFAGGYHR
jgi:hypothetical protein